MHLFDILYPFKNSLILITIKTEEQIIIINMSQQNNSSKINVTLPTNIPLNPETKTLNLETQTLIETGSSISEVITTNKLKFLNRCRTPDCHSSSTHRTFKKYTKPKEGT